MYKAGYYEQLYVNKLDINLDELSNSPSTEVEVLNSSIATKDVSPINDFSQRKLLA